MGGGNALEVLDHYKNKIMRYTEDEGVLLHCLGKLDMVKVTIPLLQDTMIGKTVGLVKKKYGDSDVGIKAKALVAKWKEVVRQEEIAQEKAREEEEKARGSQSADESPEQSADRSPDQSADRSPGGGSADQEDDTNDEPPEYIPTPVVPAYIPTPINKLQAQEPGASSDTLHRKSHKHKKSSRERETEDEIKKEESRREREERKEREHKRDKEKKDLSSSEHKDKSRDHKSSRSHKEKERDKEREEERRKEKRRRDENEVKHRHTSRVEADSGGERERGSGGESGATIKIKEEGGGSIRIKEEGGGSSSRPPKPEKEGAGRHKDSASIRIKEEGGGSTRAKDEGRSKHRSEEERRKHSHSKEYSSTSRKIKEEYTEDSVQGVKSSSQLNCDKVESAVQHVSGSQQNGDTNDSRKRESSSSKHKKDKHRSDRHKDKHRESRKDKPEKSSETKKRKPAEYMELDIFSQLPLDNNIKDKSRKRHRQEDVPSEGELSEKRKKVDTTKIRTESPLDRSGSGYTPSSAAVLSTPQFASLPVAGLSGANSGLSLPEISPLYKPLPRPPIQSRHMVSEEEALDALMGKKGSRSAVYSGKKRQRFFGEVPSLYDQCIMVLQDHVDDIDEVGPLNYDILEPVLERAAPQTLIHIEDLNQHLMTGPTNTSKLWEKHCLREFRNKAREEMESWREMYERCTYEREQKLNQLKGKIKTTQTEAKDSMRKSKLAYPDAVPKPPREVASKQAKHGTGLPTGTVLKVGAVVRPKVSDPTAGQASRPSAPKKNKVPPMMQKAKSMMKGMSRFGRR